MDYSEVYWSVLLIGGRRLCIAVFKRLGHFKSTVVTLSRFQMSLVMTSGFSSKRGIRFIMFQEVKDPILFVRF